jgi:hypothetical protein
MLLMFPLHLKIRDIRDWFQKIFGRKPDTITKDHNYIWVGLLNEDEVELIKGQYEVSMKVLEELKQRPEDGKDSSS